MPKSRRDRTVALTKTTSRKGSDTKAKLIDDVRQCADDYARLFVFSVQNMRNERWKELRAEWKHSRFFFGKNKVMAHALGKTEDTEHRKNLHKISELLVGQCGLLFTNKEKEEVYEWFGEFSCPEYARSGNVATETVELAEGPLAQFPHSLEPHLRQLGLPTTLKRGVVSLVKDHVVCRKGDTLKPEQCRILKLLGQQQAEFRVTLHAVWTSGGQLEVLTHQAASDAASASDEEISDLEPDAE
ncbi:mRNA turnover protein 4 homolog [Amphibalanus amphitrite]|uniref:mRNA turnover protein 4 homolog n=1 Tax=Amphibalanus amphitrite TaxID=1232801 RepID=UPI001C904A77|nr:mRNA turnover protein 4 homolog [Amphibalanus amphitrite]XP_043196420.1 mRNA turnover protein 4 homolog [Amphibalanus amphitrite]XP_043206798.1 mRNA turnover protein 4 homolog [Amphibalanus amphitrite]XP_043206799.1 mRNA turnover protein 4 homolog [Amphibalanus amphitrite]XP_043206800.1 mRNA turnover protein 4 homolog [Amphibalanus amphitrite]